MPGSTKVYISDIAADLRTTVSSITPTLLTMHRETGCLARLDLVAAGDPTKIQLSTVETGVFGGSQLLDLHTYDRARRVFKRNYGRLQGGLADDLVPEDFDPDVLARGTEHELEHTDDPELAQEIAMDHLAEDSRYYEKLSAMEWNGGYYVWVIGRNGLPLDEGPHGPKDLESAKTYARIAATKGDHDRAVSRGRDPRSLSFEIVRQYRAKTGERVV